MTELHEYFTFRPLQPSGKKEFITELLGVSIILVMDGMNTSIKAV